MTKAASGDKLMDIHEFAQTFCVTEKAVRGWIADGMPVKRMGAQGRGKKTLIPLCEAAAWWFYQNRERLELDRARTRLADAQADKYAMENAERRSDLAPLPLIKREFGKLLAEIRRSALAMAAKLAPELEGLDINERKAAIDRAVFDFLDRMAAWNPEDERPSTR